ncbi:hypothetical protein RIF29_28825 [Crotalaria pallida]|uniref:Uncharacterized protein n=1 Tax=Crotalaria pallida TaxID=3830 RepID=A0AAN9HZR8_CROPI
MVCIATWFFAFLYNGHNEGLVMIMNLIYAMWFGRNEWVFKQRPLEITQFLHKANSLIVPQILTSSPTQNPEALVDCRSGARAFVDASLKEGVGTGVGLRADFLANYAFDSEGTIWL